MPARAQWAAIAAPALPDESATAPSTPAPARKPISVAAPRSLNDPVAAIPSSLRRRSRSGSGSRTSGVVTAPRSTGTTSAGPSRSITPPHAHRYRRGSGAVRRPHALQTSSGTRTRYLLLSSNVCSPSLGRVIAALAIPRFAFAVVSRRLGLRDASTAAALAPEPGGPPRVGEQSAAAEAAGVRPGMRLSEALALCPQLALLPPDPIAGEEATELLSARLEDLGLP